ncbi:MAG TPA: PD-(D/E)XK nuclease family protein, partial [Chitinophagales bacterium]|nr:PD-(D/E)XK nuclease family protein [Chitinophagales bacterium]
MQAFLQQIAHSVSKENLPYLYKRCYIFPTKRAGIYFIHFLKEKFKDEQFILPVTITIQEFITQYTTFIIKNDWDLLLELYVIQHELTPTHQAFEKFMPWGKLILKDFDECDKYLVDVTQLFSLLKAQKEIDQSFSISDEVRAYIEQFILTKSSQQKESIFREQFIKTWSLLGDMYMAFQHKLKQNNTAYEGMAYRDVLENLKNQTLRLPYSKISFCGFNALSVCEEEIFKTIEQQYDTEFWWDADLHFMQNKFHEAGNFLRDYQSKFSDENNHWIMDDSLSHDKSISIIGISSDIGQTEYVAEKIDLNQSNKTAVVLCDEQLLSPLLYAIDTSKTNITMGYAIAQSELYLLLTNLLELYGNTRIHENKCDYYHKNIEALATHTYFKNHLQNKEELKKILPYFVPYMPAENLQAYFPEILFQTTHSSLQRLHHIIQFIETLNIHDDYFISVKEVLLEQLFLFMQTLKENQLDISIQAMPFIVKQFLSATKIPFETNKESNVHIMGFLETRILDFDTLYILSLNDDKLPGTNKTNSFIPYNLRKYFALPTFDQFDGVNAYHFYRLMKRAKNIHLLYNNQIGDNASEMSRFIRQIQHDFDKDKNSIQEQIATLENQSPANASIKVLQIEKTDAIKTSLRQRTFSASALKVYIKCPLQFYLKYVAGIKEPETLEEDMDASTFGTILHKVMEDIYAPTIHKTLTAKEILSFSNADFLKEKIKNACIELKLPKEILQGSNRLQLKIIERIAQKIIHNDATETSLNVFKTENLFIWEHLKLEDGSFVKLQGTFDRVDHMSSNSVRIVDYKTGSI